MSPNSHLRTLFMIWSLIMISCTFLFCFLPGKIVLMANIIVFIWISMVYLSADIQLRMYYLLRLEFAVVFSLLVATAFVTFSDEHFPRKFFGSSGCRSMWIVTFGLLVHLGLFIFSQEENEISDDSTSYVHPMVVYRTTSEEEFI